MKFVTWFEYFPRQGSGNIKSGNSFHKFHMPYALVQDPLYIRRCDRFIWRHNAYVHLKSLTLHRTLYHRLIYIQLCNWLISRSGLFSIKYLTRSLFLNNLRQCFPVLVLRTKYLSFYWYHLSRLCLFVQNNGDMRISLTKCSALVYTHSIEIFIIMRVSSNRNLFNI
jgi:hypothetical protein